MDNAVVEYYNSIIAPWRIVREIGRGGFGCVYKIVRKEFDDFEYTAALKVIRMPQDSSEAYGLGLTDIEDIKSYYKAGIRSVINECRLMSQFKGNSNIVSYEDHRVAELPDAVGWDILIRMEYLKPVGSVAKTVLADDAGVIKLGMDMCRALELCARKNILHRDIKPANIFISETGDFKLGDFGISRTVENTTGAHTRTGTLIYMAPEVYRGESYREAADIYSLGLVLYSYLNDGRLPFIETVSPESFEQAKARRLRGERLPRPASGSEELAAIVLKACEYKPEDRFESAAQMLDALEKLVYRKKYAAEEKVVEEDFKTVPADDKDVEENFKTVPAEERAVEKKINFAYDGGTYSGDWNGMRNGIGTQRWNNGSVYEGEWRNNKRHGSGKYTYASGSVYEGEWRDNKAHGRSKCTYANGDVYEGEWRDGEKHGIGKYTYANGAYYDGEWFFNNWCGKGTVNFHDGTGATGTFYRTDGKLSGKCTYYSEDGHPVKIKIKDDRVMLDEWGFRNKIYLGIITGKFRRLTRKA